ncbi:Ulp1 protease family carboxy-terminal domain protein, partial [Trifolium pratense]
MSVVECANLLCSNPTDTTEKYYKDDVTDNDSTATSPNLKRKYVTRKSKLLGTQKASSAAQKRAKIQAKLDDMLYISDQYLFSDIRNHHLSDADKDDTDFYLNYHPAGPVGYEGVSQEFQIPRWMPIAFRPSEEINLSDLCAYTATYIFKLDPEQLLGDEVLVQSTTNVIGDRKSLKSLMPKCHVDEKVINLVVARQNWLIDTIGKMKSIWYMPTEFAQHALEEHKGADYVRNLYQANYMTARPSVSKMFIPMNDNGNHWYLMIVDFIQRKLVCLDSLRCDAREHFRRRAILKMAIFLEEIIMHESFSEDLTPFWPDRMISNYALHEPKHIAQQIPESNDSGVWVSKWMTECPFRSDYGNIIANTASRMRIAINLVKA